MHRSFRAFSFGVTKVSSNILRENTSNGPLKFNKLKLQTTPTACNAMQHRHMATNNNLPSQAKPSGFVLHLANPINIFRNWWTQIKIQWNFDPEFSYQTFLVGAKQGASVFMQLLSQKDYAGMKGLVNEKTIKQMVEKTYDWSEEQCMSVTFDPEEVNFAKPRVTRYINIDGVHYLDIDVFLVALKSKNKPQLVELTMRFSKEFGASSATDWTIARVGYLNVKEFQNIRFRE